MRSTGFAALVWILAVGSGWPQTPALQVPQPMPAQLAPQPGGAQVPGPPLAGPEPAAPENPGLFNEMGKVLEKSLSILPTLKSPGETLNDLHAKTKDVVNGAGEGLSRLTTPSSMVTGRVPCPAANGASDCKMAADRLCQSKGFKEGKSLSTDSAETCSAKVLIPGRARKPGDCRTDNFVTRALCQ